MQVSSPDDLNKATIYITEDEEIVPTQMQTPPTKSIFQSFRKPLTEKENHSQSPSYVRYDPLNIKIERPGEQTPIKSFLVNDSPNDGIIDSSIIDSADKSNDSFIDGKSKRKCTPKRLFSSAKKRSATATASISQPKYLKLTLKNSSPRLRQSKINFNKNSPSDKAKEQKQKSPVPSTSAIDVCDKVFRRSPKSL